MMFTETLCCGNFVTKIAAVFLLSAVNKEAYKKIKHRATKALFPANHKKENFKMNNKFLSILILLVMLITCSPLTTFANTMTLDDLRENYGAISVEAYNLGQGFLVEPSLYAKEGKSVGDITVEVLTKKNIGYTGDTSYFSGFEFDDTVAPTYPEYLEPYSWELDSMGDGDGYLAEFDYSMYAGWCYSINDWWGSLGVDSSFPGAEIIDYNTQEPVLLGDVIRWHFTVSDWSQNALCFCYKQRILPNNTMVIMPKEAVTRAEIADMLYNMLFLAKLL